MATLKDIEAFVMAEPDQEIFFKRLGQRIADLRKEQGMSQRKLAELLGLSQQIVASYETGERHIPVWRLLSLAGVLGVSPEELLSESEPARRKPGPVPTIQRLVEKVNQLPKSRQRFVVEMLEDAVARAQ